jgi:ubiquitin-conjugating enzyme E2 J2
VWSVSTILTGLLSFMLEAQHTTGAISSTKEEKRRLARQSLAYNARNPTFRKLFPEWIKKLEDAAVMPAPGSHPQQPPPPPLQQQQPPPQQQQDKQQQQVDAAQTEGQQAQPQPAGAPAAPQVGPLAAGAVPAARLPQGGVGGQWSSYALGAAAVVAAAAAATAMLTLD